MLSRTRPIMRQLISYSVIALISFGSLLHAQTFPTPSYFQHLVQYPHVPTQLSGPQALEEYIVDGKLRLSLQDSIRLMLLNSTGVRINQAQVDQSGFGIGRAYSPFDPVLSGS